MTSDAYQNTPDETDRLGYLLHDASRLLRKRFEERAVGYGLSSAQWRLLARVFKEEGVTQARLAELLEIEPISVSRLIDRMEEPSQSIERIWTRLARGSLFMPSMYAQEAHISSILLSLTPCVQSLTCG